MAGEVTGAVKTGLGWLKSPKLWLAGAAFVGVCWAAAGTAVMAAPVAAISNATGFGNTLMATAQAAGTAVSQGVPTILAGAAKGTLSGTSGAVATSGYTISPSGVAIYNQTFSGQFMASASGLGLNTGTAAASGAAATSPLVGDAPLGLHLAS